MNDTKVLVYKIEVAVSPQSANPQELLNALRKVEGVVSEEIVGTFMRKVRK